MVGRRGEAPLVPPYRLRNIKWDGAMASRCARLANPKDQVPRIIHGPLMQETLCRTVTRRVSEGEREETFYYRLVLFGTINIRQHSALSLL